MKSLVQEAATIEKAISQAWSKAHRPQQFQVKILEEPERNFLGMVTRSAKIAIFFEEHAASTQYTEKKQPSRKQQDTRSSQDHESHNYKQQERQKEKQTASRKHDTSKQHQKHHDVNQRKDHTDQSTAEYSKHQTTHEQHDKRGKGAEASSDRKRSKHKDQKKPHSLWTQERVKHASNWLRDLLDKMGYTDVSFSTEPQNLYLRIELSDRLLTRKDKEKQLLASLASLMMATMQRKYNKAFRGHKVVLTHP